MADTERAYRERPGKERQPADVHRWTGRLRGEGLLGRGSRRPATQLVLFDGPEPELTLRPLPRSRSAERIALDESVPVRRNGRARLLLVVAVVGYIWLFGYWTTRIHDGLGTQAFDLGIYDQGIWLLSRLKSPFVTVMGRQLLGDHTSFILLPLVPIYMLIPSAKVLLVAQALLLGIAALPAFLLAREKLRDEMLAALLAVALLLQPVLGWTNLEQFHPDVFEVPLVLFALLFMVKRRWVPYFVCVGLLLLVKEDVVLFAVPLGIYVAVKHNRTVGLITCAAGAVYFGVAVWWILPALNGVGSLNGWRIPFGGPSGLVRTSVTHPGQVIAYLSTHDRLWYLWQLLAPLALVALAAPGVLLIGAGALGSNMVSNFLYQYNIHYHYSTIVLPVIVAATIFGVASWPSQADRRTLVTVVLGASLVAAYMWGPTPLGRHEASIADPGSVMVASFHNAVRMLPADAVVSTSYSWLPQIDHREEVYMFPNPWKASYWGTFKQEGQRLPRASRVEYLLLPSQLDPEPKAVFDAIRGDFDVLYDQEGVLLLRRR